MRQFPPRPPGRADGPGTVAGTVTRHPRCCRPPALPAAKTRVASGSGPAAWGWCWTGWKPSRAPRGRTAGQPRARRRPAAGGTSRSGWLTPAGRFLPSDRQSRGLGSGLLLLICGGPDPARSRLAAGQLGTAAAHRRDGSEPVTQRPSPRCGRHARAGQVSPLTREPVAPPGSRPSWPPRAGSSATSPLATAWSWPPWPGRSRERPAARECTSTSCCGRPGLLPPRDAGQRPDVPPPGASSPRPS